MAVAGTDDAGYWKANAYAVKSELDLFNDFTYFLNNPVFGDQFHQHDNRVMAGANASRALNGSFAGLPMQTTFGVQSRYDAIDLALSDTFQRSFLSNIRSDKVGEGSVGVYAQNTVKWTDWLKTTIGWRGDYYQARVNSIFDANKSVGLQLGVPLRIHAGKIVGQVHTETRLDLGKSSDVGHLHGGRNGTNYTAARGSFLKQVIEFF